MRKKYLVYSSLIAFILITTVFLTINFTNKMNIVNIRNVQDSKIPLNTNEAGWVENGTPVCNISGDQLTPAISCLTFRGSILTWADNRSGNLNIFAQRINLYGNVEWKDNGTPICTENGDQLKPQICTDGIKGAIITWYDERKSHSEIYAQKIDLDGNVEWTEDGEEICTISKDQKYPQICGDGSGGAIIAWSDERNDELDIYAQRVNSSGDGQWTTDGIPICTQIREQIELKICSDGAGGAIMVWADNRSGIGYDIYAQRIDSNGITLWTDNGTPICTEIGNQRVPELCLSGKGSAIITWRDLRGGNKNIYAQRINRNENLLWLDNGTPICTEKGDQWNPRICSDGHLGAIITWYDERGSDNDIYAQKINSWGNIQWADNGTPICTEDGDQLYPRICCDSSGRAIITWRDKRAVKKGIYAQKIDTNGRNKWKINGTPICTEEGGKSNVQICCDGLEGAFFCWVDSRGVDQDIFVIRKGTQPISLILLLLTATALQPERLDTTIIIMGTIIGILIVVVVLCFRKEE